MEKDWVAEVVLEGMGKVVAVREVEVGREVGGLEHLEVTLFIRMLFLNMSWCSADCQDVLNEH